MITGERKKQLTPETVLHFISEYDIFRHFMPNKHWQINQATFSPFRNEKHESFLIGNKHGNLKFTDFSDSSKHGDCFEFVKQLYHLSSIDEVLHLIDKEFGLGIASISTGEYKKIISEYKQPDEIKRYSVIQVITRKFTKEELDYWNSYHISLEELRENHVYSIKSLFFNKSKFPLSDSELRFGYLYPDGGYWKIYRPFSDRKNKWMPNNVPIVTMDGKENIVNCKVAFINKSRKDYIVIKKLFPCSCAVQNEGLACFSPENVQFLKLNSERQILSFDSDVVGVTNSQQITKLFNFDYCNVPKMYLQEGVKDWSDLGRVYGMKVIEDYLKQKELL